MKKKTSKLPIIEMIYLTSIGCLLGSAPVLANEVSTGAASTSVTVASPLIELMLKQDVGIEEARPIDAAWLQRLSLKSGVQLTWEANTRTGGQILRLPIGSTFAQAEKAAKVLGLEPGVLWAEAEEARVSLARAESLQAEEDITQFIVKLNGDKLSTELDPIILQRLIKAAGVEFQATGRTTLSRILTLASPVTLTQAMQIQTALESLPQVTWADPNRRVHIESASQIITPNDPLFWRDWHLQEPYSLPDQGIIYTGAANIQAAWGLTKGKTSTGVAVLDTGILFEQPDLKRSLGRQSKKRGWDMVTATPLARDGNGRDANAQDEGDWVDEGTGCLEFVSTNSSSWHGSHVAGIIGATTNNKLGVSGISWKAKIIPVRVLAACGGSLSDLADGILWAAGEKDVPGTRPNRSPIQVMNLSLGDSGPCPGELQAAIDGALARNISIVVAAGNSTEDVSNENPANCKGVIRVAAVSPLGDLANYSNYGDQITVAAPGGQQRWNWYDSNGKVGGTTILKEWGVWSTVSNSLTTPDQGTMTYTPMQGTSMAAPVVSGVISLMLAADKKKRLTPVRVANILQSTARPFPSSVPRLTRNEKSQFSWELEVASACTTSKIGQCGAGIVDAAAAVQAVIDLQK